MATEEIRKKVTVIGFSLTKIGIYITYTSKTANLPNEEKVIDLDPLQSLVALERIGSIDKLEANPITIWWESPKGTALKCNWEQFFPTFILSQYEAIQIAVRHEYEQSLKSDMNLLEIDKALEALQ